MRLLICASICLMASCAIATNIPANKTTATKVTDNTRDLKTYIENLDSSCAYQDGYTCAEKTDPRFYSKESHQSMLPAVHVQAWTVAYEKFISLKELTDQQKQLHHYKIGFAEQGQYYIVLFLALRLPYFDNGKANGVSTGSYGMSVKMWVDKQSLSVSKQLFLK